jgi:hypothetical protein
MALKLFSGLEDTTGEVVGGDSMVVEDASTGALVKVRADHPSALRRITAVPQGNATVTVAQAGVLVVSNSGTMTLTLPTAASAAGLEFTFIKATAAAWAITLDGDASETINGATTLATMDAQYDTITIVSNGTAWFVTHRIIA